MAGHSHSANIKYRKDRSNEARSLLFVKLRRQLEQMIIIDNNISDRVLNLAKKNNFPKEKLYKIKQQLSLAKTVNIEENKYFFYKSRYNIFWMFFIESFNEFNTFIKENIFFINYPLVLDSKISSLFELTYLLEIPLIFKDEIENFLLGLNLDDLKNIFYEETKIIINLSIKKNDLFKRIKKELLYTKKIKFKINEIWKSISTFQLNNSEEIKYYEEMIKILDRKKIKFISNIEYII